MQDGPDALCCLCLVEGVRVPAVKGWVGMAVCRECLAESAARRSGQPAIVHVAGYLTAPARLQ